MIADSPAPQPPHARAQAACEACVATCADAVRVFSGGLPPVVREAAGLCASAAQICGLAVRELSATALGAPQTCALAAVVCRTCAEECERHAQRPWIDCAAACRRAAQELNALALLAPER